MLEQVGSALYLNKQKKSLPVLFLLTKLTPLGDREVQGLVEEMMKENKHLINY